MIDVLVGFWFGNAVRVEDAKDDWICLLALFLRMCCDVQGGEVEWDMRGGSGR